MQSERVTEPLTDNMHSVRQGRSVGTVERLGFAGLGFLIEFKQTAQQLDPALNDIMLNVNSML